MPKAHANMRCDLNITTCRAHANIVVVDLNKIQNASESSSCLENIAAACCCSTGAPRYVTISSPPKQPRHQNSHPPFQNDFCTYHVKSCHIVPLVCFLHRSLVLVLRRALVLALRRGLVLALRRALVLALRRTFVLALRRALVPTSSLGRSPCSLCCLLLSCRR